MGLSFKKPDSKAVSERERVIKEAQQSADEAIGHAQNCLKNDDFVKYRDAYENLVNKTMTALKVINEHEKDPAHYGFAVKGIVERFFVVALMLEGVYQDAGKK